MVSLLERLILHGKDHETAGKRTVQTLIDYGASANDVDNQGRSTLDVASSQGQPYLTAYLLQRVNDISSFSSRQLLELLFNTTRMNDYTSFNLLVEHSRDMHLDDESVQHFYALTAESTDNASFIDFYLSSQRWSSRSNLDNTEVLERAILRGHFTTAQRIFEQGHVNLSRRMPNKWGNESTILGWLLARAKKYQNAVSKIQFFLSLARGGKDVFFNVCLVEGMEFTALHAVSLYADYHPDLAASGPVMDIILDEYHDERHLNAQISGGRYAGCTALHLAVQGGNIAATDRLLQEEMMNSNILDDQGETAFDKVKKRWRNQARFMADVPMDQQQSQKEEHDQITSRLDHLLTQAGAICRKYISLVRKIDEGTILMEVFGSGEELFELNSTSKSPYCHRTESQIQLIDFGIDSAALDDISLGLAKCVRDLKPNHIFLIGTGSDLLDAESEVVRQKSSRLGTSGAASRSVSSATSSRLKVEVISHPTSRIRVTKTTMDHDLSELCDFLRR
ncbi:MAG: hypothetical protein M1839_004879 [Geoglossum umbratile]|nr:MAG: hypothetical protein M1839_004879 [Geoglossum umbratile]